MIRKVERADLPECARVIRAAFRTVADEFGLTEENAPRFTAFATDTERLEYHMDAEHRLMYLDEEDGTVCGYCSLLLKDGGECELGSLSVLPAYRHRGIGEKLLRHAAETAAAQGCRVMNLSIVEENTVLRRWYESKGAVHTGTRKFDFFPFTCGYMQIPLPMLYVKAANMEDAEQEWLFVRDMPPDENGLINEWNGVSREEFVERALPQMIAFAEGRGLPEGYVPETFLFLWDGSRIVGQYRIRHYLCESLRTGAGHIGYFIGKAFRGKGYGTEGLRLALEEARKIVPEEEFYLRVNRDNPASLRVMLKNGGRIVAEDGEKYYVRIPNPGKKAP